MTNSITPERDAAALADRQQQATDEREQAINEYAGCASWETIHAQYVAEQAKKTPAQIAAEYQQFNAALYTKYIFRCAAECAKPMSFTDWQAARLVVRI